MITYIIISLIVILFGLVCYLWIKLNNLIDYVSKLSDSFTKHLDTDLKTYADINKGFNQVLQILNEIKKSQ